MYYCITLYKVVKIQNSKSIFLFLFKCSFVCWFVKSYLNFRCGNAFLKGSNCTENFFFVSMGINFVSMGIKTKFMGNSVSLSVVFIWEYRLQFVGMFVSLITYPDVIFSCWTSVWLVVPTKDSPIYNMVCMMFLFRERTFLCKEYHTWSSLYGIQP